MRSSTRFDSTAGCWTRSLSLYTNAKRTVVFYSSRIVRRDAQLASYPPNRPPRRARGFALLRARSQIPRALLPRLGDELREHAVLVQ
eukprot:30936-Pelagococcus_subviridis.AAC.25